LAFLGSAVGFFVLKAALANAPIIPVAPTFTFIYRTFSTRAALSSQSSVNLGRQSVLTEPVNLNKQDVLNE